MYKFQKLYTSMNISLGQQLFKLTAWKWMFISELTKYIKYFMKQQSVSGIIKCIKHWWIVLCRLLQVWVVVWFWARILFPPCLNTLWSMVGNDRFSLWAGWASQHHVAFRRLLNTTGMAANTTRIHDPIFSVSKPWCNMAEIILGAVGFSVFEWK